MRVLVIGGAGMLGHKLLQVLAPDFDTFVTLRQPLSRYDHFGLYTEHNALPGCDVREDAALERALAWARPEVVINAVGIIKQLDAAHDPTQSLLINALLPHRLLALAKTHGCRLLHISTDCVFSGERGGYVETDFADARDLYGRTKFLGELTEAPGLTLRTSIIGRELETCSGLLEWFLCQRGRRVRGFAKAIYSGFPTVILAQWIARILREFPALSGVYHVSTEPISKFDLLRLVRDAYGIPIEIERDETFRCDRSMLSERFRAATGLAAPSWPELVDAMHRDSTPYDRWRSR